VFAAAVSERAPVVEQDPRVKDIDASAHDERERQKRLAVLHERIRADDYHVFLCHNHQDKPQVRQLAQQLREQGIVPWLDEEEILAGTQFPAALERVIDEVPAVAVILGPHAIGQWQSQEYYAFLRRFVERRDGATSTTTRVRLIPVVLPGVTDDPGHL
jgi:TIR domain